nr:hypothetical protein [Caldimonas sp.]
MNRELFEDRFHTRIPEERLDPPQAGLTLARFVDELDAQLAAISSVARSDAPSPT